METRSESSAENLLEFNDVRLAFLSVFPFPDNKSLTRKQAFETLKEKGIKAEWSIPYSTDFEIAEEFLLPKKITTQYFRLRLNDVKLSFAKILKERPTDIKLPTNVFLAIYPKVGVGILLFNMKLNQCNVDDLIFLQHSLSGRTRLNVVFSLPLAKSQEGDISLKRITQKYVNLILSAFGIAIKDPKILVATCVEIRSLSNFEINDPKELFENFPNQVYGLLLADEGWRFVPAEIAKARMQSEWRTRNFLSVVTFGYCVIVVNLEGKETHKKYLASQKQIRENYNHKVEEYFTYSPEIAGLNHGPLFMLENGSVQRFIIEQMVEQIIETEFRSIKETLNFRENLLDALSKLSYTKIPEIGLLGQNVQDAMRISKGTEELKKKLEEVERTRNQIQSKNKLLGNCFNRYQSRGRNFWHNDRNGVIESFVRYYCTHKLTKNQNS